MGHFPAKEHILGDWLQAQLYDAWVMRDGDGHMFDLKPPFDGMHSSYTRDRLRKGLPFPVTTCWNGMVVLPAKPFREGLRIRHSSPFPFPWKRVLLYGLCRSIMQCLQAT